MGNYYCLVAGFPEISFDEGKLSYTLKSFREEIYPQLSAADKKVVDLIYLQFDNRNFLKLVKDKDAAISDNGNFSADDFHKLFLAVKDEEKYKGCLPEYFRQFYNDYVKSETQEPFCNLEDKLSSLYFDYGMHCKNKFARAWFEFNLNINNILVASIARKYKMDVASHVVGDTVVANTIRKSMARDFDLSSDLDYVEEVIRISEMQDLIEREKRFDILKWNWIDDNTFFEYFSIEKVLSFLLKIEIVERWITFDKETGSKKFREIIDGLKKDVQIPDEFKK